MLCLMCGQDNSDEITTCPNCDAPMPKKNAGISSAPPQKVYERYNLIKSYAEKIQNGDISDEEYTKFIRSTKEIFDSKEKDIRSIEIPQEFYNDFLDEMETGFQGLELMRQGLDMMIQYIAIRSDEILSQGLAFVYDGNEKINEAMSINRENRRQMEELYLDSSFM